MNLLAPRGIVCPLATPIMGAEEDLDGAALRRLLDRVVDQVDGVLALGSSGEAAVLRTAVADRLVATVLEHVDGRVPVYVGVGSTGTRRTIAAVARLAREGVAAVFVCGPYYFDALDSAALVSHFRDVADASPLPVVLYNIPQNTGRPLNAADVGALAVHGNIVGIKDSSGDLFTFQEILATSGDALSVLQGREQLAAVSLWAGASGVVSALANLAPDLLRAIQNAVQSGDRDEALRIQREVTHLAMIFGRGNWLGALKAALCELGVGNGRTVAPGRMLDTGERAAVRSLLAAHNRVKPGEGTDA